MLTEEQFKEKQKHQWNAAAVGWEKWDPWYALNIGPLTDWLCRAAGLAPGSIVLDIASGSGQPALSAAARVRPGGHVVATDVSRQMLAVAERKARAAGLENVTFREADAERLPFEDHSFDAVTCACGIMFCPDPVRAATEIRRVLKPGGRLALAVWDEPAKNSFFTTIPRAVAQFIPAPPPDPKAPGAFRLAPPGEFEAVLRAGGFSDFAIESRPMTFALDSLAQYWELFTDMAAGIRTAISTLSEGDLAHLTEIVEKAVEPYVENGHVHLTATALCASGRR